MKAKPVLVVIGAGSITFTPKLLRDMIHHPGLGGSTMRLVDIDADALDMMEKVAKKLNATLPVPWRIEATTDRREALSGADFVIVSVDVARNTTWESDWRIPVEHGIRQVTGELGGPGGLFHSLRQIPLHIEIGRDCAELCPQARVMVESNPLNRICLAMRRHTGCGEILGLCHGVEIVHYAVSKLIGVDVDNIESTAPGTNHFTWILDLYRRDTGEDLYPALRRALATHDPSWWPLSRKVFEVYGCFPSCGDDHIGEYLPWAWELAGMEGPHTDAREDGARAFRDYLKAEAAKDGPFGRFEDTQEGLHYEERAQFFFSPRNWTDTLAFPIMDSLTNNTLRRMPTVNMVNGGAITNLPADVFVEGPASVDASGCRLISLGDLPKPLAAFCRRDIDQAEMIVEAAVSGKRSDILKAMLLDPVVDSVSAAEKTIDAMLAANAEYLRFE